MDVFAAVASSVLIEPGRIATIGCGFSVSVPEGYEAQLRPRSGLASKSGVTLVNSPGTVDSDYRGEIMVALINLGLKPFEVTRGLRVAQMVFAPIAHVVWKEVERLEETKRSSGGFGHTGDK
jgi:dUTP pyrophosphatase